MNELLRKLAIAVDPSGFEFENYPDFIFLCGGKIGDKASDPLSLRHHLINQIEVTNPNLRERVLIAEDVYQSFFQSPYDDLLAFERDLADFCSLTVIIAESPGAIAELGAFSVIPYVAETVLAVIENHHYGENSFIRYGPVESLRLFQEDRVQVHHWLNPSDRDTLDERQISVFLPDLIESIQSQSETAIVSRSYNSERPGYRMLCILELARVAQLIKFEEITRWMSAIGVELTNKQLKCYLAMLQSIGFIRPFRYSGVDYYACIRIKRALRWNFHRGVRDRDIIRWSHDFREYYREHDKPRYNAMNNYMASLL